MVAGLGMLAQISINKTAKALALAEPANYILTQGVAFQHRPGPKVANAQLRHTNTHSAVLKAVAGNKGPDSCTAGQSRAAFLSEDTINPSITDQAQSQLLDKASHRPSSLLVAGSFIPPHRFQSRSSPAHWLRLSGLA